MRLHTFSLDGALKDDPLREFFVWWLQRMPADLPRRLRACLDSAQDERPLQQFLTTYPALLTYLCGGGHGRWVIPQKKLGSEFVPDFVIGEKDSGGFHWTLVELESPRAKLFTRSGDPARQLNHAMSQIRHWCSWLEANRDYAMRPRTENGLGLTSISSGSVKTLIFIGRRSLLRPEDEERRRQLERDHKGLKIHTYDWFLEAAEAGSHKATKRPQKEVTFREGALRIGVIRRPAKSGSRDARLGLGDAL